MFHNCSPPPHLQASVQEVCEFVEQQFASVQAAVKEARRVVMEVLEEEQRRALRQAEGIQAHLVQRRTELMKTLAQMNKMSRIKSDVDFLQVEKYLKYLTWCLHVWPSRCAPISVKCDHMI